VDISATFAATKVKPENFTISLRGSKPFSFYFQYASNVHKYNTRYASKQNLYVKKVRTNMGKQTIGDAACVIWDKVPLNLKELRVHQFSKQLKPYLLSEQHN